MVFGLFSKKIDSLDDLAHPAAKPMAEKFGLGVEELMPMYLAIEDRYFANEKNGGTFIDGKKPETLSNDEIGKAIKEMAGTIVICLELQERKSFRLPVEGGRVRIQRDRPRVFYESVVDHYSQCIDALQEIERNTVDYHLNTHFDYRLDNE